MTATEWWLLVTAVLAGGSAAATLMLSLTIVERAARTLLPAAIVALAIALAVSAL